MTIGELAAEVGLETHVLRHWDSVGVLKPASRVNGRRRYGPEHRVRVAMILRAQEAGLSLDQIGQILDAGGKTRRAVLMKHRAELDERLRQLERARQMIEHALECEAERYMDCPVFQRIVGGFGEERQPAASVVCRSRAGAIATVSGAASRGSRRH